MRTGSGRCARINVPTGDGRIIRSLTHRALPNIPVTMHGGEGAYVHGHDGVTIVGKVTQIEVFAHRGEWFAAVEITEDWAVAALEAEQHYMEIDIDDVTWNTIVESNTVTQEVTYGRIAAIHLGKHPCWDGLEFRLNP